MIEVGGGGLGVVLAPELHMIGRVPGTVQGSESGREEVLLRPDQGKGGESRAGEKGEFELELDPDVADMTHRLVEPAAEKKAATGGDAMDDPLWPGVAGLGAIGHRQPRRHQAIQRPVHQGAAHGEDSAHRAGWGKLAGNGEPVRGSFHEEAEHGVLGQ